MLDDICTLTYGRSLEVRDKIDIRFQYLCQVSGRLVNFVLIKC